MKVMMYKPNDVFSDNNAELTYVQAMVAGILQASGCEVEQLLSPPSNNLFIRDHVALLERDPVVIRNEITHDIDFIIQQISGVLPKNCETVTIRSSFVGGNILRVSCGELSTLFYGDYNEEAWTDERIAFYAMFFKAKPTTNSPDKFIDELNQLKKTTNPSIFQNTVFKLLRVNNTLPSERPIFEDFYYHLDCFITFVPDGKIIVLNKKMLQPMAYTALIEAVGEESIIDLAYDEYLKIPLIFNPIVIPLHKNRFLLLCSTLPEALICKLESFGYYVITPASLNSAHFRFNAELAEHVTKSLNGLGWRTKIDALVSEMPGYQIPYSLSNIKHIISLLSRKESASAIIGKLMASQAPFQVMTKNEALLLLSVPSQAYQGLKGGNEKERVKQYLQLLCTYNPSIAFDFTEFDKVDAPLEIILLKRKSQKTDISFVVNKGSIHCLTQECPTRTSAGNIELYSPAQPLFTLRNDLALLKKYQLKKETLFPTTDIALRRAAGEGNLRDVVNLIGCGAAINAQGKTNGYTALHWACQFGHVDVIEYLIVEGGADPMILSIDTIPKKPFDLIPADRDDLRERWALFLNPQRGDLNVGLF